MWTGLGTSGSRARTYGRRGWSVAAAILVTVIGVGSAPIGATTPTDPPPPTTAAPASTTTTTSGTTTSSTTTSSTTTAPEPTVPPATEPETSPPTDSSDPEHTEPVESTTPASSEPDDGPIFVPFALPALVKDASVPDVSPGESFNYTFIAGCSGLQESCPNAVMTDVIPADLEVISLPESTDQYTVAFDEATNTMTVTFIIPLPSPPNAPGQVGLPDGASVNFVLGVELPSGSQLENGDVVSNTAVLTADDADPIEADADVPVVVEPNIVPVADKDWADGGAVAGTGETSTITLGVRNGSSSASDIRELVVEDLAPAVFERFDVTGLGAITFPAGANQVIVEACTVASSACGDGDWTAGPPQTSTPFSLPVGAGTITGLRFRFANSAGSALPFSPDFGTVEVEMALRDTVRSTGDLYQPTVVDNVQNCAAPAATNADDATGVGDDACTTYSVYPAQATMTATKSFFSDANGNYAADGRAVIGLDSPVSALTSITNTSPFPVATMTITEPSASSPNELEKIDITDVRFVFPSGATEATLTIDCGGGVVLVTDHTPPPGTVDLPTGCAGPSIESVSVTFVGDDGAGNGTITGAAPGRLGVHGTLNDLVDESDATNGPGASGDGVANCASGEVTSSIDGVGSASGNPCANLAVWLDYSQVTGVKSAQLPTVLPGLPRLFNLSFTNGGTIPATDVIMADPLDPTAAGNPFDTVRLADLNLPAAPPAVAEVWDPDIGAYVPYDAADAALLERARGFRVTVPEVAAGQTFALTFNVILRDGVDTGFQFRNCAGVGSNSQTPAGFCSQDITVGAQASGAAIQKLITPAESVRPQPGLPATTSQIKLAMQNTGTRFLRQLVATDTDADFFDAVDLTGTVRVNFPPGADRVRVDACTGACGDGDWTLGTVTASQTPALPVPAADVRGVRVAFTAVPVSTPTFPDGDEYRIAPGTNFPTTGACTGASVCIDFRARESLRSSPDTPTPDTLSNTASGGYESRTETPGTLAPIPETSATHDLTEGTAQLNFSKTPDRTAAPGVGIPFVLRLANTGTGAVPNPTIVEPIPTGLDFSPLDPAVPYDIAYTLPAGTPEPPEVVFTQETDPDTGQATSLRWEFPGWDLVPGASVSVEARMMLAPGVAAGTEIENRAGATGERPDLTCSTSLVPRPGEATDDPTYGDGHYCTSAAVVTVGEGNAFRTQKWVAGDPSLGFLKDRKSVV